MESLHQQEPSAQWSATERITVGQELKPFFFFPIKDIFSLNEMTNDTKVSVLALISFYSRKGMNNRFPAMD